MCDGLLREMEKSSPSEERKLALDDLTRGLQELWQSVKESSSSQFFMSLSMRDRLRKIFDSMPKTTLRLGKKRFTVYKEMGHRYKVIGVHAPSKVHKRSRRKPRPRSHLRA